MGMELLFLLLPGAFVSGWWVARRGAGLPRNLRHKVLPPDYFRGLNYLLTEQPDKAIGAFEELLAADSDVVEAHLALGNLFRRRGEVDRAIRIHQNLLARSALTQDQRNLALFELAQDYLRSGILGRAESLFNELVDEPRINGVVLKKLLDIYQQERDWEKAIATATRVESVTGESMNALNAQFCCEIAAEALEREDLTGAQTQLVRALGFDGKCVRATLLKGAMEAASGDCRAALRTLRQVETQDPAFLSEVIAPISECFARLGAADEAEHYFEHIVNLYGGVAALLALTELRRQRAGDEHAAEHMAQALRRHPSIRCLDRLVDLTVLNSDGSARENLLMLKEMTSRLLEEHAGYKCAHCGMRLKMLHWQCPSCKTWANVRPREDIAVA